MDAFGNICACGTQYTAFDVRRDQLTKLKAYYCTERHLCCSKCITNTATTKVITCHLHPGCRVQDVGPLAATLFRLVWPKTCSLLCPLSPEDTVVSHGPGGNCPRVNNPLKINGHAISSLTKFIQDPDAVPRAYAVGIKFQPPHPIGHVAVHWQHKECGIVSIGFRYGIPVHIALISVHSCSHLNILFRITISLPRYNTPVAVYTVAGHNTPPEGWPIQSNLNMIPCMTPPIIVVDIVATAELGSESLYPLADYFGLPGAAAIELRGDPRLACAKARMHIAFPPTPSITCGNLEFPNICIMDTIICDAIGGIKIPVVSARFYRGMDKHTGKRLLICTYCMRIHNCIDLVRTTCGYLCNIPADAFDFIA